MSTIHARIVIAFLAMLTTIFTQAQDKDTFPTTSDFYDSFSAFLADGNNKKLVEANSDLADHVRLGHFSAEETAQLATFANQMRALRMTKSPYFLNFVRAINGVKTDASDTQSFQNYVMILRHCLAADDAKKSSEIWNKFAEHFFSEDALRYDERTVTWRASNKDYKIKWVENQPLITYAKLDLRGTIKENYAEIKNTAGTFKVFDELWSGKGGEVYWNKIGLPDDVLVYLSEYDIDVTKPIYSAENVEFVYPELVGSLRIKGRVEDKVSKETDDKKGFYPKFESYETGLKLESLGKGISILSGIRVAGSNTNAYGTKDQKAQIILFDPISGAKKYVGKGMNFLIRSGEKIVGEQVESTLYFDGDSLYHPSVMVVYKYDTEEIQLTRGDRGSDRNPFFNSYYQFNIDVDQVGYYVQQDSIVIGQRRISLQGEPDKVYFESANYYNKDDYEAYQNISNINPINTLLRISKEVGSNVIPASSLAYKINPKYEVDNIKRLLYTLASDGFIFYDEDTGEVTLREKLFHWARASIGKVDYDPINIKSETETANAYFDTKSKKMVTSGVKSISFSRTQKVALIPDSSTVTMVGNRDLEFDGVLYAGYSTLTGKDMHFNYQQFEVETDSVRFMDFFLLSEELDDKERPVAKSIDSRLEHLTGRLLIDAPNNKSGVESIASFPTFVSQDKSYVFYDRDDIHHGAYMRDSFFFELNKFTFNSLDKFIADDLQFKGELHSADIFPIFKDTIFLRIDESLGLEQQTGSAGFPAYQNRGTFIGNVDLTNQGFFGQGEVKYLTASILSDDVLFKPYEMTCTTDNFNMTESRSTVPTPKAHGEAVKVLWKPYNDSMYVRSKDKPFDVYSTEGYTMDGTLIITPDGLRGRGRLEWEKGIFDSDLMEFGAYSDRADTANLRIKALEEGAIALQTNNLSGSMDYDKMVGSFESNFDSIITHLPVNQYQTNLNAFDWDIKNDIIEFKQKDDAQKAYFQSTDPDQDTLKYEVGTARYELKTNQISLTGVDYFRVADAFIYTKDGKAKILSGGMLDSISDAKIVADTASQYHVFNRANVQILGKKDYRGTGYYEYNLPNRKQEIFVGDIVGQRVGKGSRAEKNTATTATAKILESQNFFMGDYLEYQGELKLRSDRQDVEFDGFARFDLPSLPARQWFSYVGYCDKHDPVLSYNTPKNLEGDPLFSGIFVSRETGQMYPRAIMPLSYRLDRAIIDCRGVMNFNRDSRTWNFGDSSRVVQNGNRGNLLQMRSDDFSARAIGKLSIGEGLELMSVDGAGELRTAFVRDTTIGYQLEGDIMVGIDVFVPDDLLKVIVGDFKSALFEAADVKYTTDQFYTDFLPTFITDDQELAKSLQSMQTRTLELPKSIKPYALFFPKVPVKWNSEYQSLVSTKDKLPIAMIGGEMINRTYNAFLEFRMPSNGDDRVYAYIKAPSDFYYFLGYQDGILSLASNNPQFITVAEDMKTKEFFKKMKNGEQIEVQVVNELTARMFLNRVKEARN